MKLKSTSFTDGTWGRVSHALCRGSFREARTGAEVTLLGGLIFSGSDILRYSAGLIILRGGLLAGLTMCECSGGGDESGGCGNAAG